MAVVETVQKLEVAVDRPFGQTESNLPKKRVVVIIPDVLGLRTLLRLDDPNVSTETVTGGHVVDLFDILGRH